MKWVVAINLTIEVLLIMMISKAIAYPSFDIESQHNQIGLVCSYGCHIEVEIIAQQQAMPDSPDRMRNQFGVR